MLFALGAASSALDAVQALTSAASSPAPSGASATGFGQADPFEISSPASEAANSGPVTTGFRAASQISPATMQALLAAQSSSTTTDSAPTSRSAALQDLFLQIDADGNGQITKSEFENALGAGGTNTAQADNVFNQFDTNGDGSVSLGELSAALKGKGGHHGHYHAASANGSSSCGSTDPSADPLLQALQGSSLISSNSGAGSAPSGSAEPSSVTAASGSGSAAWSYHSLEQMIQRQVQALSFSAPPLSFNA